MQFWCTELIGFVKCFVEKSLLMAWHWRCHTVQEWNSNSREQVYFRLGHICMPSGSLCMCTLICVVCTNLWSCLPFLQHQMQVQQCLCAMLMHITLYFFLAAPIQLPLASVEVQEAEEPAEVLQLASQKKHPLLDRWVSTVWSLIPIINLTCSECSLNPSFTFFEKIAQGVQKCVYILTPPFLWPRLTDLDILRRGESRRS